MSKDGRSQTAELLILTGLGLAFIDECVRKSIQDAPVIVTGVKDAFFLLAGLHILVQLRCVPRKYAKYFVPWVLVSFVSGLWVFGRFQSLLLLGATLRTYTLTPLLFAVGYYLGRHEEARRRAALVFMIGGLAAILAAILQEHAKASLPDFLTIRIYKERHSGTGGDYNESLFASPQTLSHVVMVIAVWSFAALALPHFSRRRMMAFLILLASLWGIYLSRIRTAIFAFAAMVFITWLGSWKVETRRREMPAPLMGILLALALVCLGCLFYFFAYADLSDSMHTTLAQDARSYEVLFDREVLGRRIMVFLWEFTTIPNHDWFFGTGAGLGGRTREFVEIEHLDIPPVRDSGMFLLYHEVGILGMMAFLICYGGLTLNCGFRLFARPKPMLAAIPAFALSIGFLAWFLLKSHTCIANGLSHALWLGHIGICCGLLDGERPREPSIASVSATVLAGKAEDARRPGGS